MGTAPGTFPPDNNMLVGQVQTGNLLGLTAAQGSTVMFTAPVSGLYLIAAAFQVVATNSAGTLKSTLTFPTAAAISQATVGSGGANITAIEQDLSTGSANVGVDGYSAAVPVWLNAGAQVKYSSVASGLTGTTYNVFVSALRLF